MKIALFSIASWAIYASASNLKLRSTSNKHVGESASQFTNARVSVFGLKEEVSVEDIDIIGETLVSAYNEMFASPDMHLVSFQPKSAAAIPTEHAKLTGCTHCKPDEDVTMLEVKRCTHCRPDDDKLTAISGAMIVGRLGAARCTHCRPDDDTTVTQLGRCFKCKPDDDTSVSDIQSQLENKFCSKLRSSASSNLASASDCSIAFLDMTEGETEHAQISLKGMLHDFTPSDTAIFNQAVTSAYNQAFTYAGYSVGSIEAVAALDMVAVTRCTHCRPDDDMLEELMAIKTEDYSAPSTVVLAHVSAQRCTHCRPDDDTTSAVSAELKRCTHCRPDDDAATEVKVCKHCIERCTHCRPDDDSFEANRAQHVAQHELMEAAFKKSLCAKLQNSGSANFANVHGCDFSFVYGAVGSEAELLTVAQK